MPNLDPTVRHDPAVVARFEKRTIHQLTDELHRRLFDDASQSVVCSTRLPVSRRLNPANISLTPLTMAHTLLPWVPHGDMSHGWSSPRRRGRGRGSAAWALTSLGGVPGS
jgi:hypothetical protein